MMFDARAMLVAVLASSSMPGTETAICSTGTVAVDVTTLAEVQNLTDVMNCTGPGVFNVTWTTSLQIGARIDVSDMKNVTITGSGFPTIGINSALNYDDVAGMDTDAASATGLFSVSSGSTLSLNHLVLEGVHSSEGGIINVRSSSSLSVLDCTFLNNNGTTGGAIYASDSEIHVGGTSMFINNSAVLGGAVYAESYSVIQFDDNTSFYSNSATEDGGAAYANSNSNISFGGNTTFFRNSAGSNGGAISALSSSIYVDGNTCFDENTSGDDGGALAVDDDSFSRVEGNTRFWSNLAKDSGGAIYINDESSVQINGSASFRDNTAHDDGGAVFIHRNSQIAVNGNTSFIENQAGQIGGAMYASIGSAINIDGYTLFDNNFAEDFGGAVYVAMDTTLDIDGHTSFTSNSAKWPGGGGIYASHCAVIIGGNTYMAFNGAYDGGAILGHRADITITGNALFAYNSADRDGEEGKGDNISNVFLCYTLGAIKTINSNTTIAGGSEGSSTSAQTTGATSPTNRSYLHTVTGISFIQNTAFIDGGAVLLTTPDTCFISEVNFTANEAMFGGAVSLTSTEQSSVEFSVCRFEGNNASRGGAFYSDGGGWSFIRSSRFHQNVAGETGGALFNAGKLEAQDMDFTENVAQDGGLAIYNLDSEFLVLRDVTFIGNTLSCPAGEYRAIDDMSSGSCRFELECAQCLNGCQSDLSNVTVADDAPPICEPIPEGVKPSSTSTSLETFDLEEGYYRVSSASSIVLECYQTDACLGGTNASNYCEIGYEGPYCAVCAAGFAPGISSRCHACSEQSTGLMAGCAATAMLLALVVAVVVFSYLLQGAEEGVDETGKNARWLGRQTLSKVRHAVMNAVPISAVSIVVVVVQIITQFTEIAGAVYPDEYEAFLSHMAVVNVDIGLILSRSCIITPDFYDRLVLATTGPLVVLLGCTGTFFTAKRRSRNFRLANPILKRRHLSVVISIVFFVYSSVSFTILQTFVCDSLDDGKAYLRADYSITCYTDTYRAYQTYAWFMVFVYPVGIPAFFAWMLVRNRQELEKSGRETISDLQSFRSLWSAYRPSCYYYEIVECGRRIVLTGAAVFVISDSAEQIALVLLLAVVFMFISESLSPFESRLDMWLYRWGNGIILASMYVALLLKVDLAVEGSHGSSAITALLIAANMFMLVTVAVQAVLLVRGLCVAKVHDNIDCAVSTFPSDTWLERSEEPTYINSELDATRMGTRNERSSNVGLINSHEGFLTA